MELAVALWGLAAVDTAEGNFEEFVDAFAVESAAAEANSVAFAGEIAVPVVANYVASAEASVVAFAEEIVVSFAAVVVNFVAFAEAFVGSLSVEFAVN